MVTELDRTHYVLGVLALAENLGVRVTATRLQKVTFLVVKEFGLDLGYKFVPYYFGPFSKDLQDDIYRLRNRGLVKVEEEPVEDPFTGAVIGLKKTYMLSENAPKVELEGKLRAFLTEKLTVSLEDLLRYVYTNYPDYTARSLIKDRLF